MKKLFTTLFLLLCAPTFAQVQNAGGFGPGPTPGIAANGGTGNNITLNGTTNITGSASNAVTQPVTDNTARIATDAFVQNSQALQRTTVNLSGVTGGTLSFASLGTGLGLTFTATGGVITSINSVAAGGTNYKVGDLVTIQRGNLDNVILITGVSGTSVTSVQILNGGTGNTSGTDITAMAVIESPVIYTITGTLTSNVTVIGSNGATLGYSGIFLVNNNTTGNYSWTICLSNGSDACNAGPTVTIPPGSSNSCATAIQTDGVTGVWLAGKPTCLPGSATYLASGSGTIPAGATQFRIILIGGGSSGAGGGTFASSGSGGGGGGCGVKLDTGWLPVSQLPTLSFTVTIGKGGAQAPAGSNGNVGGDTSIAFGSFNFGGPVLTGSSPAPTAGSSGATSSGGAGGNTGNGQIGHAGGVGGNGGTVLGWGFIATSGPGSTATGGSFSGTYGADGPSSGGSGGGLNSGVAIAGGSGGLIYNALSYNIYASGGSTGGGNGANGALATNWPTGGPGIAQDGAGGGGGGGNGAGVGGNGGTGSQPGGGGGGGGSGTTGGGTGGAGGDGAAFVEWQ